MSHTSNLIDDSTVFLTDGVGGWNALDNASIAPQSNISPYTEELNGVTQLSSLRAQALSAGDLSFATEIFVIEDSREYKGSVWIGTGEPPRTVALSLRFYDSTQAIIATDTSEFVTRTDFWSLSSVFGIAPVNAVAADFVVEIEDALPNEYFWASYPSVIRYDAFRGFLAERIEDHIPDFMIEADKAVDLDPQRPLARFIDVGINSIAEAAALAVDFDYVRAEDSLTGEDDNSSLTDPTKANFEWLGWLAQQVGVRLSVTGSGFTNWDAFAAANIVSWDDWEEDIVPGGSGDDTTWASIETFDAATLENLESFRNQVATVYNGVMSSTVNTISNYTQSLLNTSEEDPFVYIRKHYRTNPWRLAVVVNAHENPDPFGTGLEDLVESTIPAGSIYDVLNGVSRSALILFDIDEFVSYVTSGLAAGYNELPLDELKFIEDIMGTGRNIILYDLTGVDDWFTGGGISKARYFGIADETGQHFIGHALTSGAVEATTGNHANLDIVGDIDIQILVSDLGLRTGGPNDRELLASANKWRVLINEAGIPGLEWQNSGTQFKEATTPLNITAYKPYWLRITLDVNNGASGHTVSFYTADTLYDDWVPLGDPVITAGTQAIASNATNGLRIFSKTTTTINSALGTVYRVIVKNGIGGTTAADINFLDITDTDLFTGALTFLENGPDTLTVTVDGAATGASNYVPNRWILLNHDGDNDYFHFGKSPDRDNAANPDNLGDTLVVSGLASANHDYTVTYYDDTTVGPINLGTNTTHTLNSDNANFGGKAIKQISITNTSGGAQVGLFLPSTIAANGTVGTDSFGRTWTLNRLDTTSHYYEASSVVDRSFVMPVTGEGIVRYGGYGLGASSGSFSYGAQAFSITYRRFWEDDTVRVNVVDNTVDTGSGVYGWKLDLFEGKAEVTLFDGFIYYTLIWDEETAGRIGQWNLLVLNLDPANRTIELWANNAVVDSTDGFFTNQFLNLSGDSTSFADTPDHASLDITGDFDVRIQVYHDDWFDIGLPAGFKFLIGKEGAWDLGYNQETGVIRFRYEDSGTQSFTTVASPFVDGQAIHIRATLDVSNGGNHVFDIYKSYDGQAWTNIGTSSVAGVATPDTSNNPLRIGSQTGFEAFDGHVYEARILNGIGGTPVYDSNFHDPVEWNVNSVSGVGGTGKTTTLHGEATIVEQRKADIFPAEFPIGLTVHQSGFDYLYQFSQLALYDHVLNEVAMNGLYLENSIT